MRYYFFLSPLCADCFLDADFLMIWYWCWLPADIFFFFHARFRLRWARAFIAMPICFSLLIRGRLQIILWWPHIDDMFMMISRLRDYVSLLLIASHAAMLSLLIMFSLPLSLPFSRFFRHISFGMIADSMLSYAFTIAFLSLCFSFALLFTTAIFSFAAFTWLLLWRYISSIVYASFFPFFLSSLTPSFSPLRWFLLYWCRFLWYFFDYFLSMIFARYFLLLRFLSPFSDVFDYIRFSYCFLFAASLCFAA